MAESPQYNTSMFGGGPELYRLWRGCDRPNLMYVLGLNAWCPWAIRISSDAEATGLAAYLAMRIQA